MDQIFMVMEFVEYDLKGVLEEMSDTNKSFAQSEVKVGGGGEDLE